MSNTSIYTSHRPGSTDDLYLKLKDGDKVKLRVMSEPACSTYDGEKLRYAWIVWNRDKNKPQVFSFGISIYNQVADLVEEWGLPTTFDIAIKRTGSGLQDTNYSVTPVRESPDLTPAQLDEAKPIDLPKAVKGRWLRDYHEDGVMPEQINSSVESEEPKDTVITDIEEPIALDDIPF